MDVYRKSHSNHHFFIQIPLRVSLFLFHGVLTSRLASFYAKKTRAVEKVEMLVAKAVRGLAPAVTGQGPGTLGNDVGWGWNWLVFAGITRSATFWGLRAPP